MLLSEFGSLQHSHRNSISELQIVFLKHSLSDSKVDAATFVMMEFITQLEWQDWRQGQRQMKSSGLPIPTHYCCLILNNKQKKMIDVECLLVVLSLCSLDWHSWLFPRPGLCLSYLLKTHLQIENRVMNFKEANLLLSQSNTWYKLGDPENPGWYQ